MNVCIYPSISYWLFLSGESIAYFNQTEIFPISKVKYFCDLSVICKCFYWDFIIFLNLYLLFFLILKTMPQFM